MDLPGMCFHSCLSGSLLAFPQPTKQVYSAYGYCCLYTKTKPQSHRVHYDLTMFGMGEDLTPGSTCRFWEGIYVLYDYSAPRSASQQVQKYLSTPIVGKELNILRHMTFNR